MKKSYVPLSLFLTRRIQEGSTAIYYTPGWQAIEERNSSGVVTAQYTLSPVYIDAYIAKDRDTDANGTLDERVYVIQDANFNVTSIVAPDGTILERFQYDAYGSRTALDSSWTPTADAYGFIQGHQGGKIDVVTGYIHFRYRELNTSQMRWVTQDPLGYPDGANRYEVMSWNPISRLDALGLDDFIALMDVEMFMIGHHYSLSYWTDSCSAQETLVERPVSEMPKTAKYQTGRELTSRGHNFTRIPVLRHKFPFGKEWVIADVKVSIVIPSGYGDRAYLVLYTDPDPAKVKLKWDKVASVSDSYAWAEHPDKSDPFKFHGPMRNWPNSYYSVIGGNDSNTFVKYVVQSSGLAWKKLSGWHPGNDWPVNVDKNFFDGQVPFDASQSGILPPDAGSS